jgi:predicted nucleic acid-binding protein
MIDTSIASLLFGGRDAPQVYARWFVNKPLGISFQTAEEMLFGAIVRRWGDRRRAQLKTFLGRFTVVPGDWDLALVSARVRSDAAALGRSLSIPDAWIIATAVHVGLPLVTDDRDQVIPGLASGPSSTKPLDIRTWLLKSQSRRPVAQHKISCRRSPTTCFGMQNPRIV